MTICSICVWINCGFVYTIGVGRLSFLFMLFFVLVNANALSFIAYRWILICEFNLNHICAIFFAFRTFQRDKWVIIDFNCHFSRALTNQLINTPEILMYQFLLNISFYRIWRFVSFLIGKYQPTVQQLLTSMWTIKKRNQLILRQKLFIVAEN